MLKLVFESIEYERLQMESESVEIIGLKLVSEMALLLLPELELVSCMTRLKIQKFEFFFASSWFK